MTDEELQPISDAELQIALDRASQDQMDQVVAQMLFVGMKASADRGVPALKAMRAIMAGYLEQDLGTAVWKELGVPTRTAERWRREFREEMKGKREIEDEVPPEIVEAYVRLKLQKMAKDQKKAAS
jgi:hypothetical protein